MIDSLAFRVRSTAVLLGLAGVVLIVPFAAGTAFGSDETPLTNVDVVRQVLNGASESEIVARVRSAPAVEFDVSAEMQDELGIAGVPRGVILAMVERMAAIERARNPPADDDASDEESPGVPGLTLRLNPGRAAEEGPSVLRVVDLVPPPLREQLGLRADPARFTDVGLFLGCRTADHVPDHWRTKTPLGRDFVGTPRHNLLAFVSGARRVEDAALARRLRLPEDAAPPAILELELPAELVTALEPDVAHDLTLGIALEAEDRFYLLTFDEWDGLVPTGPVDSTAIVAGGNDPVDFTLEVRFESAPAEPGD